MSKFPWKTDSFISWNHTTHRRLGKNIIFWDYWLSYTIVSKVKYIFKDKTNRIQGREFSLTLLHLFAGEKDPWNLGWRKDARK